jgi:hypothetical protein
MTDKGVERVARALWAEVERQTDGRWPVDEGGNDDLSDLVLVDDGLSFIDLAHAACAACESAVTDIAKLGTVSLTSFDGHCVRIDFPNREDAERMYAVLTKGSK